MKRPQLDVERTEPATAVSAKRPGPLASAAPVTNRPTGNGNPSTESDAAPVHPTPVPAATPAPAPTVPEAAPAKSKAATSDGVATAGVFRVQVGAFLDHRNADRLVARLRNENFEVLDSVTEQSRVLYRVLAHPRPGEGYDSLLAEIRRLGFTPEMKGDSAVVTGPVQLQEAVEASRALKDRGIRVRLERQASSGAFRVVRVGQYPTAEEAERARAELASRGLEGIVVRER